MSDSRRKRSIYYSLESAIADIERSIDDSESRVNWRTRVRGVLMHWLGLLYDEGVGNRADLVTAIGVLRSQVNSLRQSSMELREKHIELQEKYMRLLDKDE